MPTTQLVQVGSNLYIAPSMVTKVYKTDEKDGTVYVVTGGNTGSGECYRTTDWPIERVRRALGLEDQTWLHELWESTAHGK